MPTSRVPMLGVLNQDGQDLTDGLDEIRLIPLILTILILKLKLLNIY